MNIWVTYYLVTLIGKKGRERERAHEREKDCSTGSSSIAILNIFKWTVVDVAVAVASGGSPYWLW